MDIADVQFVDGGSKYTIVYKDGCEERKNGNVQFLFLFNDRITGVVCRQDNTRVTDKTSKQIFALAKEGQYEYSGNNGAKKKDTSA